MNMAGPFGLSAKTIISLFLSSERSRWNSHVDDTPPRKERASNEEKNGCWMCLLRIWIKVSFDSNGSAGGVVLLIVVQNITWLSLKISSLIFTSPGIFRPIFSCMGNKCSFFVLMMRNYSVEQKGYKFKFRVGVSLTWRIQYCKQVSNIYHQCYMCIGRQARCLTKCWTAKSSL